ncbi:hypothetical protein X559_0690 [Paenilisteria newyorkensis]|nr:hypothetical protein X559_0690 [Listeria newyorkensis]
MIFAFFLLFGEKIGFKESDWRKAVIKSRELFVYYKFYRTLAK